MAESTSKILANLPSTEIKPELLSFLNETSSTTSSPQPDIEENTKRWLLVGLTLNGIVSPALRKFVEPEINALYVTLSSSNSVGSQTFRNYIKKYPTRGGRLLNYEAINNNKSHRGDTTLFNYNINNPVDLSKLFLQTHMTQYRAFDETCDSSALLGLIRYVDIFHQPIKSNAEAVRSKIRNPWAHCNFKDWDTLKYQSSFQVMETLIRTLPLSSADQTYFLSDLHGWKNTGFSFLGGTRIGMELLTKVMDHTSLLTETVVHLAGDTDDHIRKINEVVGQLKESMQNCLKVCSNACNQTTDNKTRIKQLEEDTVILYSRTDEIQNDVNSFKTTVKNHSEDISKLKDGQSMMKSRIDIIESKLNYNTTRPKDTFFQVPNRLDTFVGREEELKSLNAKFVESGEDGQTLAICGLGGIGKTTLAIEYAWLLQKFYPGGVFWLSAADEESLHYSIDDIAFEGDIEGKDTDDTVRKVLRWLSSIRERWLLVVDNVDEYALSKRVRNILTGPWKRQAIGHTLITTRREIIDITENLCLDESRCIELDILNVKEGVSFMEKRTKHLGDESLDKLVKELEGLPLALEQAAAYINTCQYSFSEYLEQFLERRLELLSQKKIARRGNDFVPDDRLTIITTWSMNFDLIKRQSFESGQGNTAAIVMYVFSICSPDDIPLEFINKGEPQIKVDQSALQVDLRSKEILSILTRFSLFQRRDEGTIQVHRLVQEVIRDHIPKENMEHILQTAVRMINGAVKEATTPKDVLQRDFDFSRKRGVLHLWNRLALNASSIAKFVFQFMRDLRCHDAFSNKETINVFHTASVFHSIHRRQDEAFLLQDQMLQLLTSTSVEDEDMFQFTSIKIPLMEEDRKTILQSIVSASQTVGGRSELPDNTDILRERGNNSYREGKFHLAIRFFTEAIRCSDGKVDDRLYANRSQCYRQLGDHKKSLEDADLCISINQTNWKGHARRSYALAELIEQGNLPKTLYCSGLASASIASYLNPYFKLEFQTKLYYPILLYQVVSCPTDLISEIQNITKRPFTSLLLPDGEYNIGQIYIIKSVQLVGLGDNVNIHIDQKTGTYLIRLPGSSFSGPLKFETDEEHSIHIENVNLVQGGGQLTIGSHVTASVYRCNVSNGIPGCRDYPKCQGGPGCVNKTTTPCTEMTPNMLAEHVGVPKQPAALGEESTGMIGYPGIVSLNGGNAYIDRCLIKQCGGGGVLCHGDGSFMSVINCDVREMIQMGLEVREGGTLNAENNLIIENRAHGIAIGPRGNATLTGNIIHDNGREGIFCCFDSSANIENNLIHHNALCGISLEGGTYKLASNQIFENWCWGVMMKTRSSVTMLNNEIFENKCGGIRIGWNYSGVVFIDGNVIRDHCGPGLHIEPVVPKNTFNLDSSLLNRIGKPQDEKDIFTSPPIYTDRNTDRGNNRTHLHPTKHAEKIMVCFFCHKTAKKLMSCGKCKKASYCSKVCQNEDWNRHKRMCRILLGTYTITVDLNKTIDKYWKSLGFYTARTFDGRLKGILEGPKPEKNSTKEFIVKIQSGAEYHTYNPRQILTLYDRSTDLDIQFINPDLYHLIMECGKLSMRQLTCKKIFCWAYFEKQGSVLRIRTDTLAPYQTW